MLDVQSAIHDCQECAQMCEQMIQHCLKEGGAHADPDHIGLLEDCVDICNLTARFLIRESSLHNLACELCAQITLVCAVDCERFESDEAMQACAKICRKCYASCSRKAKAA